MVPPLILLALLCLASGCTSTRYVSSRSVRENPLTNSLKLVTFRGPEVSERTWHTLNRFGLADQYTQDHQKCFEQIRQAITHSPDSELVYALSELSYVEGKKAERSGDLLHALNHYGIALTNSYDYLFSEDLQITRNAFDPQFRAACDLYNESLEDTLRILCSEHRIEPGSTYTISTPDREFIVRTEMRGKWKPEEFDRYEFVSDFDIETLNNRHTTYGLGVPLIAVRKPAAKDDSRERYYPTGLSYAVSAMMRCSPGIGGRRVGESPTCVLEFFDPLEANQIEIAKQWVPLETDLTTPLAYFLDSPEFRKRNHATEGLLDPDGSQERRGVYMLEPYDPNRIPVLMVHGLWSSPLTWMDMFNDLRSFPEIRERYQFWFYLYPTGQPFWISAQQLRKDLAAMRESFDPGGRDRAVDQMVLVGHSMGGLVSRLQTMESGNDFWKIVSDHPADEMKGTQADRVKLVSTLFFKPNQSVGRVITIGTPHRGSDFSNDYTQWLARKFIKLPQMFVSTGQRLTRENPDFFRDTKLLTAVNAVDSLSPKSPIFPVMLRAKKSPNVKFHNIIGVLEKPSLLGPKSRKNDGVVEYASAHMDDVESEITVDAEHTQIHMTGKAIFEVRRILLEHLQEVDANDRIAIQPDEVMRPGMDAYRR
ncbi:esterase/lipase family protein [Novipirellula galeiformis]|uniref:esterase/lipase family protein n=1 Tax=Novipirellula galeiformis TaxID=2528004 RepID=UPI0036F38922